MTGWWRARRGRAFRWRTERPASAAAECTALLYIRLTLISCPQNKRPPASKGSDSAKKKPKNAANNAAPPSPPKGYRDSDHQQGARSEEVERAFYPHCRNSVLLQVERFNRLFWDTTQFPPSIQPQPKYWQPQDEAGDPLPEENAHDEWISACTVLAPPGGRFTCMDGIASNRWHMYGKPREVCACFSFLTSITPVHNSAGCVCCVLRNYFLYCLFVCLYEHLPKHNKS